MSKYCYCLLGMIAAAYTAAATTQNIYNSQGYLIAECQLEAEQACHYLLYEGLSNTVKVGDKKYQRYLHGPTGKIAVYEAATESEISFLVPDFHQSISVMVQQDITQSLLDAFGNPLTTESNPIPAIYTDNHPIEGTDLYNFKARFYDAEIGRFTITDPLEQSNLNWFIYTNNNPLAFTDPDGKNPRLEAVAKAAPKALGKVSKLPVVRKNFPTVAEHLQRSEYYYRRLTSQHGPIGKTIDQGVDWIWRGLVIGGTAVVAGGTYILDNSFLQLIKKDDETINTHTPVSDPFAENQSTPSPLYQHGKTVITSISENEPPRIGVPLDQPPYGRPPKPINLEEDTLPKRIYENPEDGLSYNADYFEIYYGPDSVDPNYIINNEWD